jgi:hypothetical protein
MRHATLRLSMVITVHDMAHVLLFMFYPVLQIFGIYMIKDKDNATLEDALQPGTDMIAAGYCMYGSSCTVTMSPRMYFHPISFPQLLILD